VRSNVTYAKTRADADADLAAVRGGRFLDCAKEEISKLAGRQLPPGVSLGSVTIDRRSLGTFGEATEAFRVAATLGGPGTSVVANIDLVLVRKGRAEATATFTNLSTPFDPALQHTLLSKLGTRLQSA
jgi:hypothetical protein